MKALYKYHMQFPKSTPDLNNPPKRPSKRQSRNAHNPQALFNNQYNLEFQIANPLLNPY